MHRFFLFLLLAGCGSTGTQPMPMPMPDAGMPAPDAGPAPEPLDWQPCPLHSEGTGPMAECADVDLPLRPNSQDTVSIHVKRWKPDGGSGAKALWWLQGGPGGSAYSFENISEQIGAKYNDIEFYLPDHRGTGKSSRIGCPQEGSNTPLGFFIAPAEWPGCIAAVQKNLGERLSAFTTTNAAADIGALIDRSRRPNQPVFVYGGSYGTYWAIRYLQLFPKQADGVILDSIAVPGFSLARQDQDANEAGQALFEICKKDPLCSSKLGADPWTHANQIFDTLKQGHCPEITAGFPGYAPHVLLRRIFGQLMMGFAGRPYIPASIYRAERCNAADKTALQNLLTYVYGPKPISEFYKQWGFVLSNNITFSEMWEDPSPTAMDLAGWREATVVSRDVTDNLDVLVGTWPVYPKDMYVGQWPATDTPILMLAGDLDPATLLRKQLPAKMHFNGPSQYWVEFPTGAHGIIASTPTKQNTSCGTAVMMSFMGDPKKTPETSCMQDLQPIDFAGTTDLDTKLFGTMDAWE